MARTYVGTSTNPTNVALDTAAIPVVPTSDARELAFPSPETNQRVHNLESGAIERWTGSVWVEDFQAGEGGGVVNVPGAEVGRRYQLVACVIRNTGSGWAFIDDSTHQPIGVSAIEVQGNNLVITYSFEAERVISIVAGLDETLSHAGLFLGPSVGLTTMTLRLFKDLRFFVQGNTILSHPWLASTLSLNTSDPTKLRVNHGNVQNANEAPVVSGGRGGDIVTPTLSANTTINLVDIEAYEPLAGTVSYNGSAWVWAGNASVAPSLSFNAGTGDLTITHPEFANVYGAQASTFGSGSYRVVVQSATATTTVLRFLDAAGVVVTTADTNMNAYVRRDGLVNVPWTTDYWVAVNRGPVQVPPANVNSALGNIWIVGVMEVLV